jgi:hypothetical protein
MLSSDRSTAISQTGKDKPMIRHCVWINFRDDVAADERASLLAEIAALQHDLPGILSVSVGRNATPETGMDKGFADGFIVDFADASARDTYLDDADHRRIGGKLVESAQGGTDGIIVFDLDIKGD